MTNEELMPDSTDKQEKGDTEINQANNVNTNIETENQENASASADNNDLALQLKEWEDKYLRLYAEFDNYRKRTTNERIELFKTANQDVLVSLLPVLDDFERALKAMENANDVQAIKEGVNLVHQKLKTILQNKGLRHMESMGQLFNPDLHEAITNIPAPTEDLKGKVVDVVEQGYYLGEKVIRYAKVVVGE